MREISLLRPLERYDPPLLRELLGETLRANRIAQGRTLRDVSRQALISLGYLSEIERGVKETSSEVLASIAAALETPLSQIMTEVAERLRAHETQANAAWPLARVA